MVLLGYYLFQGWVYWQARAETSSLSQKVDTKDTAIRLKKISIRKLTGEAEAATAEQDPQARMELAQLGFAERSPRELMAILSGTAWDTGIELTSMNPEPQSAGPLGDLSYQVQPITVNLRESMSDFYRFLSRLREAVPGVVVGSAQIADIETLPRIETNLQFYFWSEAIQEAAPEAAESGKDKS